MIPTRFKLRCLLTFKMPLQRQSAVKCRTVKKCKGATWRRNSLYYKPRTTSSKKCEEIIECTTRRGSSRRRGSARRGSATICKSNKDCRANAFMSCRNNVCFNDFYDMMKMEYKIVNGEVMYLERGDVLEAIPPPGVQFVFPKLKLIRLSNGKTIPYEPHHV